MQGLLQLKCTLNNPSSSKKSPVWGDVQYKKFQVLVYWKNYIPVYIGIPAFWANLSPERNRGR